MIRNEPPETEYRPRIDVSDYFDLRSWAKRFGVTPGDVRRAVSRVGDHPKDVEAWLQFAHAHARAGAAAGSADDLD